MKIQCKIKGRAHTHTETVKQNRATSINNKLYFPKWQRKHEMSGAGVMR